MHPPNPFHGVGAGEYKVCSPLDLGSSLAVFLFLAVVGKLSLVAIMQLVSASGTPLTLVVAIVFLASSMARDH